MDSCYLMKYIYKLFPFPLISLLPPSLPRSLAPSLPSFLPSFLLTLKISFWCSNYLFCFKIVQIGAVEALFRLAPMSFWHDTIILWALLYFPGQQNVPGSYCAFCDPEGSAFLQRVLVLFSRETKMWTVRGLISSGYNPALDHLQWMVGTTCILSIYTIPSRFISVSLYTENHKCTLID